MGVQTPVVKRPTSGTPAGPDRLQTGQVAGHEVDDVLITVHSTVSADMQAKAVNEHARQWPMTGGSTGGTARSPMTHRGPR